MPPKAKAKDKGKAPQTQPTKPESPKPSAKLMSSAILAAKPIKSWYEAVIEEEETTKPPQVQTVAVQQWVDTISKSLELLLALQKVFQQTSSDSVSQTGSIYILGLRCQVGFIWCWFQFRKNHKKVRREV